MSLNETDAKSCEIKSEHITLQKPRLHYGTAVVFEFEMIKF